MRFGELTQEQVELLKSKVEYTLEQIGYRVENAEMRSMCRAAGAQVDEATGIVKFAPELLRKLLSTIPSKYTINSAFGRSWEIGGGQQYIGGIVIDPWTVQHDGPPRRPKMQDLTDNLALMELYDDIAQVSRMDFPVAEYDGAISSYKALEQFFLRLGKHYCAFVTSLESLHEYFDIGRILLQGRPLEGSAIFTVAVASLSPLAITDLNCRLMMEACRYGFTVVPTTCPMAGSTSPYSMVGTLLQGITEVVALAALTQVVNPGNPYLFAFGPSTADLADGHDMYYTMEKPLWKTATVELARSYGIPCCIETGGTMPGRFDMQSGAEAMVHMLSGVGTGADILSGVGSCYNANGLSSEQIVFGMALKRAADFIVRGIRFDTLDQAIESMKEQLSVGHYLADDLTLELMRSDEFFSDPVLDYMGEFRQSPSMYERAHERVVRAATEFKSPVPEDVQKEIKAYFNTLYKRF